MLAKIFKKDFRNIFKDNVGPLKKSFFTSIPES